MVDSLDRDEELLATLYAASANPYLLQLIRTQWQLCRAYKIFGAREAVDSASDDVLWHFQARLIEAAEAGDGAAAAAITDESLRAASSRIEAHLAAGDDPAL